MKYLVDWFGPKIETHSAVESTSCISANRLGVHRKGGDFLTIAPIQVDVLTQAVAEEVLRDGEATIICLVPKTSHYLWVARERANQLGSDVQTMREVFWALGMVDPQGFLDKDVDSTIRILGQHSRVERVQMICESTMKVVRLGGMSDVKVSVAYGYEFGEETLVKELERHPDVDVVLNSNPNGRATASALEHAKHAGVRLLDLSSLMGELRNS
ncbi:hypothetical protein ACIP98_35140 [Streptomyces sp. NPDC088354]|uniref:hypothetical protein n=1 Tax=Streptomyces sp. NPDC088354 TaxID=3365856 RepID=UPI0037F4D4B4